MLDQSTLESFTFNKIQYSDWKNSVAKLLNSDMDVEQKLLFKSVEGIDIFPLSLQSDQTIDLLTFPEQVSIFNADKEISELEIDVSKIHNASASVVQEMIYTLNHFYQKLQTQKKIIVHVACDSLYFINIAKLRAMRFCFERLVEEISPSVTFEIHAYNSLREQTLFDPWVNMLRSTVSSMASIIGGADQISSFSYDKLYSIYSGNKCSDLGKRQADNILKILLEESHLGIVSDAMKGSYSVDNLTLQIVQKSWDAFLKSKETFFKDGNQFSFAVNETANKRFELLRTRKQTITGINNFANPGETLNSIYKKDFKFNIDDQDSYPIRPVSFEFESLREKINGQEVMMQILMVGAEDKLSARVNFTKNYFEILGVNLSESSFVDLAQSIDSFKGSKCQHIVLCGLDEDYKDLDKMIKAFKDAGAKTVYLAGNPKELDFAKLKQLGLTDNIFMGQNIYSVLSNFVQKVNA